MQFKKLSLGAILLVLIGIAMVGCSNDEGTEGENGHSHTH